MLILGRSRFRGKVYYGAHSLNVTFSNIVHDGPYTGTIFARIFSLAPPRSLPPMTPRRTIS